MYSAEAHPVRYAVDPWVATVIQGSTAGIEGVCISVHLQFAAPDVAVELRARNNNITPDIHHIVQ